MRFCINKLIMPTCYNQMPIYLINEGAGVYLSDKKIVVCLFITRFIQKNVKNKYDYKSN